MPNFFRCANRLPMKCIVVFAVLELFADAAANLKMKGRRDGYVSGVK